VNVTDDGLDLLRRETGDAESIGSVSFTERFSFALGRTPAEGGRTWLHLGNNISLSSPTTIEQLIGTPDVLMVQRYASPDGSDAVLTMHPELLTSEFEFVASSEYWDLYRRATP